MSTLITFSLRGSTTLRVDATRAQNLLMSTAATCTLAILFADDDMGATDALAQFDYHGDSLQTDDQRDAGNATWGHVQSTRTPIFAYDSDTTAEVNFVDVRSDSRRCLIVIWPIARLRSPWPDSIASVSSEAIQSIALRSAVNRTATENCYDIARAVSTELVLLNSRFFGHVIDQVTDAAALIINSQEIDGRAARIAFDIILQSRSRLQGASAVLTAEGMSDTPVASELSAAIATCDSLTSAIAGMAAVVIQEDARHREKLDAQRNEQLAERDRFIARLAASLLLPGIWVGFLGTNVLPSHFYGIPIQSEFIVFLVAGITLLLAVTGWAAVPLAMRILNRAKKS